MSLNVQLTSVNTIPTVDLSFQFVPTAEGKIEFSKELCTQPDDSGALGSASESFYQACRLIKACVKICKMKNSKNQTAQN